MIQCRTCLLYTSDLQSGRTYAVYHSRLPRLLPVFYCLPVSYTHLGVAIKAGADYFPLLEGKAGRKVILSVYDPVTGKRFEETLSLIHISLSV